MPATRRDFLATAAGSAGLTALSGCSALSESEPPIDCSPVDHDWPMSNYDPARTSDVGDRPLPPDDAEISHIFPNSYNGGGEPSAGGSLEASPVVDRGVAYAAGIGVEAREVATGQARWVYDLDDNVNTAPVLGCGSVFVSSVNHTAALDRDDGNRQWKTDLGTGPADAGPVLVDDALFHPGGGGTALDAETGETLWTGETESSVIGLAVDDRVYAATRGDEGGALVALGVATGDQQWRTTDVGRAHSPPAIGDERVYVVGKSGDITAASRTDGSREWHRQLESDIYASLAVGDGRVFTPAGNGNYARAFDAESGERLWRFETGISHATPVVLGDSVLVTSANDGCYLLDAASGEQQWYSGDLGVVDSQPVVVDEHLFYVNGTTSEGYVFG